MEFLNTVKDNWQMILIGSLVVIICVLIGVTIGFATRSRNPKTKVVALPPLIQEGIVATLIASQTGQELTVVNDPQKPPSTTPTTTTQESEQPKDIKSLGENPKYKELTQVPDVDPTDPAPPPTDILELLVTTYGWASSLDTDIVGGIYITPTSESQLSIGEYRWLGSVTKGTAYKFNFQLIKHNELLVKTLDGSSEFSFLAKQGKIFNTTFKYMNNVIEYDARVVNETLIPMTEAEVADGTFKEANN